MPYSDHTLEEIKQIAWKGEGTLLFLRWCQDAFTRTYMCNTCILDSLHMWQSRVEIKCYSMEVKIKFNADIVMSSQVLYLPLRPTSSTI